MAGKNHQNTLHLLQRKAVKIAHKQRSECPHAAFIFVNDLVVELVAAIQVAAAEDGRLETPPLHLNHGLHDEYTSKYISMDIALQFILKLVLLCF